MDKLYSQQKLNILAGIFALFFISSCSTERLSNTHFGFNGRVKSSMERIYEAEVDYEAKPDYESLGIIEKWTNGNFEHQYHSLTKFDIEGN